VYSVIWAKADRGSVRGVLLVALALVSALHLSAQAQTGGAAAPSWRGSQGAGAHPAANGPGQGRLYRSRRAASAQTPSNVDIESVLYNFCSQGGVYCTDGIQPSAGLIVDASGNLYGTTNGGGSANSSDCNVGSCGYGTVFKLSPSGSDYTKTVLYNFCSQTNCTDGATPYAGLIEDAAGDLYGTTYNGGANGGGTVFKLTPSGNGYTESVLYNFCSQSQGSAACTDGVNPQAGVIQDSSGNLYGTTNLGGTGVPLVDGAYAYGTVFMLAPSGSGYNYAVLYNFCPPSSTAFCTDGAAPNAALIEDASGNLYGTTVLGGTGTHALECAGLGCGTVFKLSPNSGGYVETVLYNFCSQGGSNCTDGAYPYGAGLIEDASGNLYGTTSAGGVNSCDNPGCGTVFRLAPNGDGGYTESVLHSFDGADGVSPDAGLIEDASGNLYGTTSNGGTGLSWECEGCSSGTVFELSPSGNGYTETVLYSFCSEGGTQCTDGAVPMAGVIQDASGNLYGTTEFGGANGIDWGTVFKLSPAPPAFTVSASPTSLTIKVGQSGTATFTVTPENGFDSAVSFACSGLPTEASCSFNPQTVTPSGGKSATTTLTITTTAPTSAALRRAGRGPQAAYALLLPGLALGLVGAARGRRTRRGLRLLGLLVLLGLALASCSSSGGGSGSGGNPGTPAGTSTVTVTAGVTGGTSQTATLTVTVTQ
jgi:uncharacterized repeat protein (TIGR03803 family)